MTELIVEDLVAGYGPLRVVNGVSLSAPTDAMTLLIGPNGAGKSTLLKAVVGFAGVTGGRIEFDGQNVRGLKAPDLLRLGVLYIPQGRSVFPDLTVQENLDMGAYSLGTRQRAIEARDAVYDLFPRLAERREQQAGSLSGGERRFVELARIVMLRPRLVLLDEPSIGVAPVVMRQIYDRVRELHGRGVGFMIVEQNVRQALEVADTVHVLAMGDVAWSGTPDALRSDERLRRLYLGGSVPPAVAREGSVI